MPRIACYCFLPSIKLSRLSSLIATGCGMWNSKLLSPTVLNYGKEPVLQGIISLIFLSAPFR